MPTAWNAEQRATVAACFGQLATSEITFKRRIETGPLDPVSAQKTVTYTSIPTTGIVEDDRVERVGQNGRVHHRRYLVRVDPDIPDETQGWLKIPPRMGDQIVDGSTTFQIDEAFRDASVYSWRVIAHSTLPPST